MESLSVGETSEYVKQLVFLHKQCDVVKLLERGMTKKQLQQARLEAVRIHLLDN